MTLGSVLTPCDNNNNNRVGTKLRGNIYEWKQDSCWVVGQWTVDSGHWVSTTGRYSDRDKVTGSRVETLLH